MKKAVLILSIALTLTVVSFGQKGSVNTDASANGRASASRGNGSIDAGTALQGQLQSTIDVNRSNVGDKVVLKTTRAVKQAGQTIVPKGTQLVGHITEIAKRSKNNSESRIGMIFDRLQGGELSQPISATIVSITNVGSSVSVGDDVLDTEMTGSSSNFGTVGRGSSSSSSSGSLLGGATGAVSGVTGSAANAVGGVTNTVGTVANNATKTVGGTTRTVGNTVNGVHISGSASGSANSSTTLSSQDKNFRIEKGATFNLMVQK
jgi:hypothetical protein